MSVVASGDSEQRPGRGTSTPPPAAPNPSSSVNWLAVLGCVGGLILAIFLVVNTLTRGLEDDVDDLEGRVQYLEQLRMNPGTP